MCLSRLFPHAVVPVDHFPTWLNQVGAFAGLAPDAPVFARQRGFWANMWVNRVSTIEAAFALVGGWIRTPAHEEVEYDD